MLAAKEDFSKTANLSKDIKIIKQQSSNSIEEADEEDEDKEENAAEQERSNRVTNSYRLHQQNVPKLLQYKWRIDLSKTEPFWVGWFQGMSQKFIDLHTRKVLLLANLSMDTALTRAQMEG